VTLPSVGEPASILEWDSTWWGIGVARLDELPETPDDMERIDAWCGAHGIDVLMALVPEGALRALELLDPEGTRLVDRRVTFSQNLEAAGFEATSLPEDIAIRSGEINDARALGDLAVLSHRETRFFRDPNFDDRRASELYRRWIEQEVEGGEALVWVAEAGSDLVGYCSVVTGATGSEATISLIAVDDGHRRRGIATHLVNAALRGSSNAGASTMEVATQEDNVSAHRLYRATGFEERRRAAWIHRWYSTPVQPQDDGA
jgi:ribosomal protein S18 acetylase RimI-like enzyme